MDFFTFITTLKPSFDIENDWFRDLWFPLNLAKTNRIYDDIKDRQTVTLYLNLYSIHLKEKIVITDNTLNWLN